MKIVKAILLITVTLIITACGSNFEWFPKVTDTTPPVITAQIDGTTIFNNNTTHITSLTANNQVTFFSNEAAKIYYTTNGVDPSTSSTQVDVTASAPGPFITISGTILKFFGVDSAANASAIQTNTIKSP